MKYSIIYDVKSASGAVTYTVEAHTRDEAVIMLKNGEGVITDYEVEPHYGDTDYEKEVYEDQEAKEHKF